MSDPAQQSTALRVVWRRAAVTLAAVAAVAGLILYSAIARYPT